MEIQIEYYGLTAHRSKRHRLVVLVVSVSPELLVVDHIVEHGSAENELVQESGIALNWHDILVPPAPHGSASALNHGTRMEVATSQP